jgi:hypothetical protein
MRSLGIEISGSDSLLVILDGTSKSCAIELLSSSRMRLPAAGEETEKLIALKKQMHSVLNSVHVECIGVIRADRNTSPIRARANAQFSSRPVRPRYLAS